MLSAGLLSGQRKGRRVEVLTPREPSGTFDNGYAAAVLYLLPAALVGGSSELQRFIVPFHVVLPQLRLHPDGYVRSPFGWDIRFETRAGTKLAHHIRAFDYGTGELWAKLQLSAASPVLDNFFVLYFGNEVVAAPEADQGAVWADCDLAVDTLTGEDWSGHGRAMTPTSIVAGTLLGASGRFSGTSRLTLADASWLSGRSSLTVKVTRQADDAAGDSQRLVHQGTLSAADVAAGLTLRNETAGLAVLGRIRTAAVAPASPYALISANWAVHSPAAGGTTVTWLSGPSYPNGGVRLRAGTVASDSLDVRIWGRTAAPAGNQRRTYILQQLDTLTSFTAAGTFMLSIQRYRGTTGGRAASPATWTAGQYRGVAGVEDASDTLYRLYGQGFRTSGAQDSTNTAANGQTRLRTYDGPGDTGIDPASPDPQPADWMRIDPGIDYLIVEDLIGTQLTVTRTRISDGQVRQAVFDAAQLGPAGLGLGGYPGFAAANGRWVEIRPNGDTPIIEALPAAAFDPAATVLSDGNRQTTAAQTLHLTWQQGAAAVLHVDGQKVTPASAAAQSDLTAMATGALYFGPDFAGMLAEPYIREALPDAWCALEGGMLAEQQAFLAGGEVDLPLDAISSPVARPARAATERNAAVSVPVAAQGFDPAGNVLALSAVSGAVNGTVAIVAGQGRFTPTTGFVGRASFDFTITNGAKSSTGRCVVTVTSPTVPPVDARADAISVLKDGSLTFDPRANDLPATGLTISAVGTPAHGTASIRSAGAAILYTPAPGYTGADSFTYTVTDGLTSDTATVSVTVSAAPASTAEYPTPASTVTVGTMAALQAEIASASGSAWKRIICQDGTYSGTLSVGKAKVQLYAENLNGAVFTSRATLQAADTIIARCKTRGGVTLRGTRARMSRCYVDNAGTGDSVNVDGAGQRVDGNEITNFGNGIQITDDARDPVIERNFLHDSNPAAPSSQDAAIYAGAGKGSSPIYVRAVIRYNRIERCKTHQHIELKCSGNLVLGNTGVGNISGFPKSNFYVRHGMDNVFALNWMLGSNCTNGASDERTHLIKVHGVSAARGGKLTGDTLRDTSLTQAQRSGIVFSEDAIICQPDGPVNLGYAEGANPQEEPRRTIIEDRGGQPVIKSMPASTYTERARTLTIPEGLFRELTAPDDVGQRWGQTLPPVKANPDTASTTTGVAVDIRPLANDTGSPIEITAYTQPPSGQGSVTSPAVGVLRFTPAAGFRGVAVFNYEASNGLTSDIDTITVEVT